MQVVATTNDPVRLSFLLALLGDAGIHAEVFDTHASITEGSIGAITRRVVVGEGYAVAARRVLRDAGEAD